MFFEINDQTYRKKGQRILQGYQKDRKTFHFYVVKQEIVYSNPLSNIFRKTSHNLKKY